MRCRRSVAAMGGGRYRLSVCVCVCEVVGVVFVRCGLGVYNGRVGVRDDEFVDEKYNLKY